MNSDGDIMLNDPSRHFLFDREVSRHESSPTRGITTMAHITRRRRAIPAAMRISMAIWRVEGAAYVPGNHAYEGERSMINEKYFVPRTTNVVVFSHHNTIFARFASWASSSVHTLPCGYYIYIYLVPISSHSFLLLSMTGVQLRYASQPSMPPSMLKQSSIAVPLPEKIAILHCCAQLAEMRSTQQE